MSQPSSHATPSLTTGTGNQSNARLTRLQRLLLSFAATGSALLPAAIAWAGANSAPPGIIQNQATGSFTDPGTGTQNIESNIVEVTVAEIAGITVSASGFTEAPAGVTNAGPNQGDGTINTEDVVYFTFDITNEGNDPTQFFIPGSATITNGSASGPIEIISYNTNGSSVTVLPTPVAVAAGGTTTGAALGLPLGSLAPGGIVRVRVPVKAATGLLNNDPITVVLGDTLASNRTNQDYSDGGANRDLYTQDNQNSDLVDVPATTTTEVEAPGNPFNGDTTFHRREASASQFTAVTFVNTDYGDAPDTYGTTNAANGARHTIVSGLHLGTAPDSETDAVAPLDGTGDGADEDGITLSTVTEGNTSYTIPVSNITATGTGRLHGWVDFDKNGTFEPSEYQSVAIANGTPAGNLTWSSITVGAAGDTYARFRFTSDGSINANRPSGSAGNGEVEDYRLTINAVIANNPSLLLAKRITAMNRGLPSEQLFETSFVNADTPDDNAVNWPGSAIAAAAGGGTVESYIAGLTGINNALAITATEIRPRDVLEYTISFLSNGNAAARNVLLCDRIPPNTTFVEDAFNTSPPAASGTGDRGIFLSFNNLQVALTNDHDGDEIAATSGNNDGIGGYYFPPGINPNIAFSGLTVNCGGANTNGAIVVDLSDIPNATGDGTPVNAYGFIRFRAVVD